MDHCRWRGAATVCWPPCRLAPRPSPACGRLGSAGLQALSKANWVVGWTGSSHTRFCWASGLFLDTHALSVPLRDLPGQVSLLGVLHTVATALLSISIGNITGIDDTTARPGGLHPRPHLIAPWLTSQVDKPQEVGLQTEALGTLLPRAVRSPADLESAVKTVKSSPGHLQNTPPTGEQPSVQRLGSAGPVSSPAGSQGAWDTAPPHCQLTLKMVRTYAVLFLFFNKINIKIFFNRAPGTTESN